MIGIGGGGNARSAGSSDRAGMDVGPTHSSLSRTTESDDIEREKSTTVGLLLCRRMGPALGVTGPTGSSLVHRRFWLLSVAARKERRSRTTVTFLRRRSRLRCLLPRLRARGCRRQLPHHFLHPSWHIR